MSVGCSKDYLEIFEEHDSNEMVSLGKFCGDEATPEEGLIISSNKLVLKFVSDGYEQSEGFLGAFQKCDPTSCMFKNVFDETEISIPSDDGQTISHSEENFDISMIRRANSDSSQFGLTVALKVDRENYNSFSINDFYGFKVHIEIVSFGFACLHL